MNGFVLDFEYQVVPIGEPQISADSQRKLVAVTSSYEKCTRSESKMKRLRQTDFVCR